MGSQATLHGNVDARYKLIRQMKITAANADAGQQLPDVLQVANTGSEVQRNSNQG